MFERFIEDLETEEANHDDPVPEVEDSPGGPESIADFEASVTADQKATASSLRKLSSYLLKLSQDESKSLEHAEFFVDADGAEVVSTGAYRLTGGEVQRGGWVSGCTLAFATETQPPVVSDFDDAGRFLLERYELRVFPSLARGVGSTKLWSRVFGSEQSSDFVESAARCDFLAAELEASA